MNKNYIVAEYIPGETLYEAIKGKKRTLNDFDKILIIIEIIISIEYVHLRRIIFRDLLFENIIVNSDNVAILVDFDQSIGDEGSMKTGDIGVSYFTSPEQFSSNEYSFKSDIYSLGKIIFFIITKKI